MNNDFQSKIVSLQTLSEKIAALREQKPGIKIGLTSGAYLVPHRGHFISFRLSKEHCDVLIVAMSSAASLAPRGRLHPLAKPDNRRAGRIARQAEVDYVVCNDDKNAVSIINTLKPDFFFKGNEEQYRSMDHPEQQAALACGGKVILTNIEAKDRLTSSLLLRRAERQKTGVPSGGDRLM